MAVRKTGSASLPKNKVSLPAWVEKNLELPEGLVAEPGPVKLWKHQVGIAEAIGDAVHERVTVQKSARVGYTMLLLSCAAYFAKGDPGPILALLPTLGDARDFVVSDFEPMCEASPILRGLISGETRQGQRGRANKGAIRMRDTLLVRRFPGGSLKVVPAKAPRNLRRHTARYLLIDESDAMENSAEGDVISLAEKRTLSFANRKIIIGSTPVDMETSHVCRSYSESDQRIYEVPCPECGVFHELQWEEIEYPAGLPKEAAWRCPSCSGLIGHDRKKGMVDAGVWRITRPEIEDHAGFRMNSLISPLANASWGKLAAEYELSKGTPLRLKAFWNTVLGRPWQGAANNFDDAELAGRAEAFGLNNLPAEVLGMTAGVDVQHDRLEITFLGFGADPAALFVLGHQVIHGPTDGPDVWEDLDDLLKQRWPHPYGEPLGVDAAAVDAGDGGRFDHVVAFCAPRIRRKVWAIKGAPGVGRAAISRGNALKTSNAAAKPLFLVGVDGLKMQLFDMLERKNITIRFSDSLDREWYDQLCSEQRVVKTVTGRPKIRFERLSGRRAEALDCMIYAMAAKAGISINLYERESMLRQEPQREVRYRSQDWLQAGGLL